MLSGFYEVLHHTGLQNVQTIMHWQGAWLCWVSAPRQHGQCLARRQQRCERHTAMAEAALEERASDPGRVCSAHD